MSLEMRRACEKCHSATPAEDLAFICSHEFSFCPTCTKTLNGICPNCGGELLQRPRRISKSIPAAL